MGKVKKIISLLLSVQFILMGIPEISIAAIGMETWDGTVAAEFLPDDDGVYRIYTAEQLRWVAENSPDGTVELMNDIDLNGIPWKSSGEINIFHGNDHVISGLMPYEQVVQGNGTQVHYLYSGLFKTINGRIDNIGVSIADNFTIGGREMNGGWLAGTNNGTVSNCFVYGEYSMYLSIAYAEMGGLIGTNYGVMENSYFSGDIKYGAEDDVFDGFSHGVSKLGGLVANNFGIINDCYVESDIGIADYREYRHDEPSSVYVGGIAAVSGNEEGTGEINNSSYYGNIYSFYEWQITSDVKRTMFVGGIAAQVTGTMSCCTSEGEINMDTWGDLYVGGAIGNIGVLWDENSHNITNCSSSMDVYVSNACDFADGREYVLNVNAGGFVGTIKDGRTAVKYCSATGDVIVSDLNAGVGDTDIIKTEGYVGSFAGVNEFSYDYYNYNNIEECYSTGDGNGMFIGYGDGIPKNCYSLGHYILSSYNMDGSWDVPRNSDGMTISGDYCYSAGGVAEGENSYYDYELSGCGNEENENARTTAQMRDISNYSGWDFDNVWAIDENINDGYPYLINNPPVWDCIVRIVYDDYNSKKFRVEQGTVIEEPDPENNPEVAEFHGWYTDKECKEKWDFSQPVNKSMTLYAGLNYTGNKWLIRGTNEAIVGDEFKEKVTIINDTDESYYEFYVEFDNRYIDYVRPNGNIQKVERYDDADSNITRLVVTTNYFNDVKAYAASNYYLIFKMRGETPVGMKPEIRMVPPESENVEVAGSVAVEALPCQAESILITGADVTGVPAQYKAEFTPYYTTNKSVEWSVSDTSVAEISSDGLLTPISDGTVTILVKSKDGSDITARKIVRVDMTRPYIKSATVSAGVISPDISADNSNYDIFVPQGTSEILITPVYTDAEIDAGDCVISEGSIIADVDSEDGINFDLIGNNGVVNTYRFNIKAVDEIFSITADDTELRIGETLQLYTDSEENIIWKSEDDTIASVDNNGMVTAHSEGIVKIYAENQSGCLRECILTIKKAKAIIPAADVSGGNVAEGTKVTLTTSEKDAAIYYTTDGSEPTPENGILYTEPIEIRKDVTIKAVAVAPNVDISDVASFSYTVISQVKIEAEDKWLKVNDEYVCNVIITNNKGLSAMNAVINYNSDALQLVSVTKGDIVPGGIFRQTSVNGGVNITWSHNKYIVDDGIFCTVVFKVLDSDADKNVSVSLDPNGCKDTSRKPALINASSESVAANVVKAGDINNDGNIDNEDMNILKSAVKDVSILDEYALKSADLYQDNVIDTTDIMILNDYLKDNSTELNNVSSNIYNEGTGTITVETEKLSSTNYKAVIRQSGLQGAKLIGLKIDFDPSIIEVADVKRGESIVSEVGDAVISGGSVDIYDIVTTPAESDGILYEITFKKLTETLDNFDIQISAFGAIRSSDLKLYNVDIQDSAEFETKVLKGIVVSPPADLKFTEGTNIDLSGLKVYKVYDEGDNEEVTDYTLSSVDNSITGPQTVYVTWGDYTESFEIDIVPKSITGIYISPPSKLTYIEGSDLDLSDMKVFAEYDNGTSEEIKEYSVRGYDSSIIGNQTVTVSFNGYSAQFYVNVAAKTLVSIEATPPYKVEYTETEPLDVTGLIVIANYDNGTSEEVTDYVLSGYNAYETGKQTITVSYGSKTAAFEVNVTAMGTVSAPVFSVSDEFVLEGSKISISSETDGAVIYYTTDGSDPDINSNVYSEPVSVDSDIVIKAIAVKENMKNSAVSEKTYKLGSKISGVVSDKNPKILDVITYTVNISENKGFTGTKLNIKYDEDKLELQTVTRGDVTSKFTTFEENRGSGFVDILAVNTSDVKNDGSLAILTFAVKVNSMGKEVPIEVSDYPTETVNSKDERVGFLFDNTNGILNIGASGDVNSDGIVNTSDVVLLTQYLAKYNNVNFDDNEKLAADVYTDSKLNTKDIWILARYVVQNSSGVAVTSGVYALANMDIASVRKLSAPVLMSSMNIDGTAETDNNVSMKLVDNNDTVSIEVYVNNNTGFTGFIMNMNYDNTCLEPVSINEGDILTTGSITSNIDKENIESPGVDISTFNQVTAVFNGSSNVTDDGLLYVVTFKKLNNEGSKIQLDFDSANDDKMQDVLFNVTSEISVNGLLGDVNGNGHYDRDDAALILRHISQISSLPDAKLSMADADGNGEVNISDVITILKSIE